MSVNEKELQTFAKMIVEHQAFPDVLDRIQGTLFKRWVAGTPEERTIVGDLANHLGLFVKEIRTIYESIDDDKPVNEDEEK